MIKVTPVLPNGQVGKAEVEENASLGRACKQCAYYIANGGSFKFFVITNIDKCRE